MTRLLFFLSTAGQANGSFFILANDEKTDVDPDIKQTYIFPPQPNDPQANVPFYAEFVSC